MRALLSVADREGISAFARQLRELDVEVYATDGTREHQLLKFYPEARVDEYSAKDFDAAEIITGYKKGAE